MLEHEYIDKGTKEAVLILHGIVADRTQLKSLWDLPYTIIAPDLPGHGENKDEKPQPLLEGTVNQLRELLEHHGVKRYHLIGYSLGGYLALEMIKSGMRPQKLVLISTGYSLPYTEQLQRYQIIDRLAPLVQDNDEMLLKLVDAYRSYIGVMRKSVEGRLDMNTALAYLKELEKEELKDCCTQWNAPALVVHGEKDRIIPKSLGEALVKALPQAKKRMLKTDHNNIVADARAYHAIREFLS